MISLTQSAQDAIRFEHIYGHILPVLNKVNRSRFRALGDRQCRLLVAHAVARADSHGFEQMESTAYLVFLMNYLGSFFEADPRYKDIADALALDLPEAERVAAARDAFIEFSDSYIGETGEVFRGQFSTFSEHAEAVFNDAETLDQFHTKLLDLYRFAGNDRESYPATHIRENAVAAAKALKLVSLAGQKTCVALAFFLGVYFWRDPLYPWVEQKVQQSMQERHDPAEMLHEFALKRMRRAVRVS